MNALADQGSDVNIMPLSIYNKLTSKKPIRTNIILSLANHSYIYPLGITEDELIDVAGFVYPINFIMLDIKEDECMPLISGTPFLTTAKAAIKFDKGRMTIMAGNYKIRFVRTLEHPSKIEERIKGDLEPIILTNHVKIRILEWEKRINNHQEKEMGLNKWRSKVFDDKHLMGHNFFIYVFGSEGCDVHVDRVILDKESPEALRISTWTWFILFLLRY
ncbi:MAK10-like protein [Tanacetum coccineum]